MEDYIGGEAATSTVYSLEDCAALLCGNYPYYHHCYRYYYHHPYLTLPYLWGGQALTPAQC